MREKITKGQRKRAIQLALSGQLGGPVRGYTHEGDNKSPYVEADYDQDLEEWSWWVVKVENGLRESYYIPDDLKLK